MPVPTLADLLQQLTSLSRRVEQLEAELTSLSRRAEQLEAQQATKSRLPSTPLASELNDRLRAAFTLPNGSLKVCWLTATEVAAALGIEPSQCAALGQVLKAAGFSRKSVRIGDKINARYGLANLS